MKLILPLLLILMPLFAHSTVPKLSEESVRIDHSSEEIRYHSKTDGIWWTLEEDGKLLLHLNLKKLKKSDFPIEQIDLDQLYAGQSIAMNDSELTDYFEGDFKPKYPNLEKHVFEAVKAGTTEKPYYQLLGGHNKMFRVAERADADPMEDPVLLNVRIVDDLTIFSAPEQTELLELYGEFWNPKNLHGTYDRIPIAQLTQSPWRSIGKIPRAKKILKDLYDPTLAYPEVVMGHRLFLKLQEMGYKPQKIKTLKQLMKIVETLANCEDALTP